MAAKTKLKKRIRVLQSSSRLFQLKRASIWVFPTKSKSRRSLLMLIKFDNVGRAMTAKKSTTEKSVLYVRFLFCFFSRFRHLCGCAVLASSVTMQSNSCDATISSPDEKTDDLMKKARRNRRPQVSIQRLSLTRTLLAWVVQKLDSGIHRINHNLVDTY